MKMFRTAISLFFAVVFGAVMLGLIFPSQKVTLGVTPTSFSTPIPSPTSAMSTPESKSSDQYILVDINATPAFGQTGYMVSLFFYGQRKCAWNLGTTSPWDRNEKELYFTSENCGIEQRNFVKWNLLENTGYLYFDNKLIEKIPVYQNSGGSYALLPPTG
jgi:hypothetical protein